MNNECIPTRSSAWTKRTTVHVTTTAVTGKKFVGPVTGRQSGGLAGLAADPLATGDGSNLTVAGPPAAGGAVEGVAMWDQVAGAKVPIFQGAGTQLPVTAGGTIAQGANLAVDATGAVVTAATGNVIVGKAITAATVGVDCEVELFALDPNNKAP